ncbi:MAG: M3 family metallopeptidase [Bacteroidetes bacterium]|nr:M3 family metallopeptidase [Bacteroidota bacterium]
MKNNPLLNKFETPYNTPAFSKIKDADFLPAIKELMSQTKKVIENISNNTEAPTFKNSVEALEYCTLSLDNATAILFNLNYANTNETIQSIVMEVAPMLTSFANDVSLNKQLFEKIKKVYETRKTSKLSDIEQRLTQRCYEGFVRGGANLSDDKSKIYRQLTEELSSLTERFTQNVLAATNEYTLHITSEEELDGIPKTARQSAKEEAETKKLEGWIFTLQAQSFMPFMKYSTNRKLRHTIWQAYNSRSLGGKFDNQKNIKKIVELRLKIANVLGYKLYSDYVLEEHMAKSTETVNSFLNDLLEHSLPKAKQEIKEIEEYAKTLGFEDILEAWDFSYYSEKYKTEHYSLSDEMLKPYFKLENVVSGLFAIINKIYGIEFEKDDSIETYQKETIAYKVFDNKEVIAILYMDFFPRQSKSGGAWMTSFRELTIADGKKKIPLISVVCNFTKPTSKEPSLLTFNEVTTVFHEVGHALHGIFSTGIYPSISGTNVARDFVELPSQIMENWAIEREFLDNYAIHHKTGERIPDELIEKIINAKNFLSGYQSVRQLSFGITDMAWHTITTTPTESIVDFEKNASKRCILFPSNENSCLSTAFTHIFSGGYSAGYYSYKWAEVLEADAFSLFKEKGVTNRTIGDKFRKDILSKGDEKDAMELYIAFRGREPKIDALLQKTGLI